eukprot:5484902-Pleurochrysis_carterae.AAC.2
MALLWLRRALLLPGGRDGLPEGLSLLGQHRHLKVLGLLGQHRQQLEQAGQLSCGALGGRRQRLRSTDADGIWRLWVRNKDALGHASVYGKGESETRGDSARVRDPVHVRVSVFVLGRNRRSRARVRADIA